MLYPEPLHFVGRRRELGQLGALLDAACEGGSTLAVVTGEPGIGKSTLVGRVADQAVTRGVTVLWGRSSELAGAPAYWPLLQVLAELVPGDDEARALLRTLDEGDAAAPLTAHARFRLQRRVADVLRGPRRSGSPRLVVLEDLHAADLDSLRVLLVLTEVWQGDGLCVIATARSVDPRWTDEARALFETLVRRGHPIELAGLDEATVAQLVASSTTASEVMTLSRDLWVRTGGNPLFLHGLLSARQAPSGQLPLTVRAAVTARLSTLPEQVLGVLRVAALVDTRFPVALVAAAAGEPVAACVSRLEEAARDGLLHQVDERTFRFSHALFAEQIDAALSPASRAETHRRIAEAMERLGSTGLAGLAHLGRTAWHFAQVARVRPEPRALAYAQRAADQARRAAAYDAATDHFALALELATTADADQDRALAFALRVAFGETALLAGRRALGRGALIAALAEADAANDGDGLAQAAVALVRSSAFAVQDAELRRWLERAIAVGGGTSAWKARLYGGLARALWAEGAPLEVRVAASTRAVSLARDTADPDALGEALSAHAHALWSPATLAERRMLAEELRALTPTISDPVLGFEAHRWRLNACWEAGDGVGAEEAFVDYARAAQVLGSSQARMNVALRRVTRAAIQGRFEEVDDALVELVEEGRRSGDPQTEHYAAYGRLYPQVVRGELAAVERDLPLLVEAGRLWHNFPAATFVPAMALLALGRQDAIRHLLDAPLPDRARDAWGYPHRLAMMGELAMALDDAAAARGAALELAAFADQYLWSGIGYPMGPVALSRARLAAFLGDTASARALYAEARERAARAGDIPRAEEATRALAAWPEATVAPDPSLASAPSHLAIGTLKREGNDFAFEFRARRTRVRASRGLEHIAALVARRGEWVPVLDLVGGGKAREVAADGDLGPALDPEAKRQYRARMLELREALDEAEAWADAGRAERARAELEWLTAELSRAVGLGGRDRAQGAAAEKARVAVAKAIRRALDALLAQDEALGRHLENALKTGSLCCYDPEPGVEIRVPPDGG